MIPYSPQEEDERLRAKELETTIHDLSLAKKRIAKLERALKKICTLLESDDEDCIADIYDVAVHALGKKRSP